MKVLILCASGNASGYTNRMCQILSSCLSGKGLVVDVEDVSAYNIDDCNGCCACRNGDGCIIHDDMSVFYRKMEEVDLLVFATPIRFSGMSSIMKRFVDRLNPFWYSGGKHPRYSCAMMCGGSEKPNFSNARSELRSVSITVGMEWAGELCIPNTDSQKDIGSDVWHFADDLIGRISR